VTWFFDPLPPCSFDAALIDPPTLYQGFSNFDSAKGPEYETRADSWVRALPIKNLMRTDALIVVWTTMPKLAMSIDMLRDDWGARYVTAGAWFKRTRTGKIAGGTGKVLLSEAEVFLLGAYGKPNYVGRPIRGSFETESEVAFDAALAELWNRDQHEAINALRRQHSRKPDDQYARIRKLMGPDARICEIFATQTVPGIEGWGDQRTKYPFEGPADV
jgi:N6-adenosine-specific RNA methylase IME4